MKPSIGICNILPLLIIYISVTAYCICITDASTVVVDSPFGKIQGVEKTEGDTGLSYVSFKGIPYAKPPVGDLRFAKPEPHPKIDAVFDATKDDRIVCPHPQILELGETTFTEDCLVLNILAKDIRPSSNSLRKVLVFIHGGGYMAGSGYSYNARSFVISQDVIVVTINYRLGIFGFLSTENEASPGNYGLWDQTLALRWVKDNIRSFGGDPDDVTIAGESAGGSSVGYQIISPHAVGLFTKAYPQSGTATSSFGRSIGARTHALTIAKAVGCWEKDVDYKVSLEESNDVIRCLRRVPFSNFRSIDDLFSLQKFQFVPRVDGDFVPDLPINLIQDDAYLDSIGFFDRSYLIGIDNNEAGLLDVFMQMGKPMIFSNNETSMEEKESAWQKLIIKSKKLFHLSRLGEKGVSDKNTVDKIDDFYNRRFVDYDAFVEMAADMCFLIPSLDFLTAASSRTSCNAYFFYFNHFPKFMKGSQKGTPHALDLLYWFDTSIADLEMLVHAGMNGEMGEDDLQLKTLFSSVVGEFIRSGNPGVALKNIIPSGWPRYDVSTSYYLNFNPNPWISSFLEKDKYDLWFKTVPSLLKLMDEHKHTEL